MSLLLHPHQAKEPQQAKRRYVKGIKGIITRGIPKGKAVTLDEAIAVLRAGW